MIGSYLVYEGVFQDRFRVRQVMGETASFWNVRCTRNLDTARVKKSSLGPHAFFETEQQAQKIANQYTDKMIKARKHFLDRRATLFAELRNHKKRAP